MQVVRGDRIVDSITGRGKGYGPGGPIEVGAEFGSLACGRVSRHMPDLQ